MHAIYERTKRLISLKQERRAKVLIYARTAHSRPSLVEQALRGSFTKAAIRAFRGISKI